MSREKPQNFFLGALGRVEAGAPHPSGRGTVWGLQGLCFLSISYLLSCTACKTSFYREARLIRTTQCERDRHWHRCRESVDKTRTCSGGDAGMGTALLPCLILSPLSQPAGRGAGTGGPLGGTGGRSGVAGAAGIPWGPRGPPSGGSRKAYGLRLGLRTTKKQQITTGKVLQDSDKHSTVNKISMKNAR